MAPLPQQQSLLKRYIPPSIIAAFISLLGIAMTFGLIILFGGVLNPFMVTIRTTPWYLLIPFIIQFLVLAFLARKVFVYKIKGLELLLGFIITILIIFLFQVIDYKHLGDGIFQRSGGVLVQLSDTLFPIAIIFLYLHVEAISEDKPNLMRAIFVLGSGIPLSLLSFLLLLAQYSTYLPKKEINDLVNAYFVAFAISVIIVGIYGIIEMYKVFYYADLISVEVPSLLTMLGIEIIFISFIIRPFTDEFVLTFGSIKTTIYIYNTWLFSSGILLFILTYTLFPKYTYALPFNVYEVMLVNKDGVTLWHKIIEHPSEAIRSGNTQHVDSTLKTPALMAISTLVKEVTQAQGELRLISLSDRRIVIESHQDIIGIVIADKTSFILKRALKAFVTEAWNTHEQHIKNFMGNVTVFKDCDELLIRTFPFSAPAL